MSFWVRRLPDVRWGLKYGIGFATVFSAIAVIGRISGGPSAFDPYHMTLPNIVAVYFAGGLFAGAFVGLLRPLVWNPFAAAVVGFIAMLPISWAIDRLGSNGARWDYIDTLTMLIGSFILGPLTALIWLRRAIKAKEEVDDTSRR